LLKIDVVEAGKFLQHTGGSRIEVLVFADKIAGEFEIPEFITFEINIPFNKQYVKFAEFETENNTID
jgi:hypothetical protein